MMFDAQGQSRSSMSSLERLSALIQRSKALRWMYKKLGYRRQTARCDVNDYLMETINHHTKMGGPSYVPLSNCRRGDADFTCLSLLEMIIGMGLPFPLAIPWESHENGNWWHNLEWEWEGMGITLYGNRNGPNFHGNKFPSADTVFSLCNSNVQFIKNNVNNL